MKDKEILAGIGNVDMDKIGAAIEKKNQRAELIAEAVQICLDNPNLNAVETGFIEGMEDLSAKDYDLTEKQYNWLMSIMEKSL